MNELALFAGAGGGILGGHLLGWQTVCAVEWEPYPASVLCARQNDGILPAFPIWDDIQTFDGRPWRGIVQVVSGGFPCQDISAAGGGAGIDGERSGMWKEMARVICEVRPQFVFVENSPMLTSRGLGTVLGDLASLGFDAKWGVLGAADVGAPHQRDRMWIVARNPNGLNVRSQRGLQTTWVDTSRVCQEMAQAIVTSDAAHSSSFNSEGRANLSSRHPEGWRSDMAGGACSRTTQVAYTENTERRGRLFGGGNETIRPQGDDQLRGSGQDVANTKCFGSYTEENEQVLGRSGSNQLCFEQSRSNRGEWWATEPNVGRVADGVAARVDRLKAIGNGQVPEVARRAWAKLK